MKRYMIGLLTMLVILAFSVQAQADWVGSAERSGREIEALRAIYEREELKMRSEDREKIQTIIAELTTAEAAYVEEAAAEEAEAEEAAAEEAEAEEAAAEGEGDIDFGRDALPAPCDEDGSPKYVLPPPPPPPAPEEK